LNNPKLSQKAEIEELKTRRNKQKPNNGRINPNINNCININELNTPIKRTVVRISQ
jgi:hypothetical protein